MHVQDQRILLRHRGLIAIEAVDQHGLDIVLVNPLADAVGEFAGRQLGGVDLLDEQIAAALHRFKVDAKALHAVKQEAQVFIENEKGGLFAPRDRGSEKNDGEQRFAGARRPQDQGARTGSMPPPRSSSSSSMLLDSVCRCNSSDVRRPPAAERRSAHRC